MGLPIMVEPTPGRPGETPAELARRFQRTAVTIRTWLAEPGAPAPVGKRGKAKEYDPAAAEAYFRRTHLPAAARPTYDATALLTLEQSAARAGIKAATARGYASRPGQWPPPDEVRDGVKLWYAATIDRHRASRKRIS